MTFIENDLRSCGTKRCSIGSIARKSHSLHLSIQEFGQGLKEQQAQRLCDMEINATVKISLLVKDPQIPKSGCMLRKV